MFRPLVKQIVFHDLMKDPCQLEYLKTRIGLLGRYEEMFPGAEECGTRLEVHARAIAAARESASHPLWLEFGVWVGESINFIASRTGATVYGFDSFEGLPVDWQQGSSTRSVVRREHFRMHALPRVRRNVQLVKGWFDQTLPPFLAEHPGNVAYLHIDSDVYDSAKTVLDLLHDRIAAGTVIVFDELFNYPGWEDNEWKAFNEFVAAKGLVFDYLAFNSAGEQVALVVR
jgi:hypothetical protein